MKKCLSFLLLFLFAAAASYGQKTPMGMKYQAVARDLKGNVLADQTISLKIVLAGTNNQTWTNYYTETHTVQTNALGLFTLVVGEGVSPEGKFEDVPWASQDIWMEVSIKDNGGFTTISNSRLLAVPFAFHAMTANQIVTDGRHPGVPGNVWSTFGNYGTSPATDALGTTDNVDMIVITNNIERMRVLSNGNINIIRSLNIGANLKVDSNVVLNDKLGSTINNGPFTVARNSPTLLSGTLTVDLATDLNASLNVDGPTDLNSRLWVNNMSPTKLTGTLQVDKTTTLNDSVFVTGGKPTVLTGRLRVDSDAVFKQHVILDNAALDQDTTTGAPASGALQVSGGGSFGGNLVIGGSARIGGGLSLNSLKVTGTTESTSTTTGAATVAGGVGIARRLNVGGATTLGDGLTVNANTTGYIASFNNANSGGQGIAIKVGAGTPDNGNNFITFQNSSGNTVGRIEGETQAQMEASSEYKFDLATKVYDVVSGAIDLGLASVNLAETITFQISAFASANVCAGLGVVACPPIASLIAGSIAEVVIAVIEEVLVVGEVVVASTDLALWVQDKANNVGVTYQSGSGDYAEYLMKSNPAEQFIPGDIVGIKGGKVSKNLEGAERIMVVSYKPIVLGNTPPEGQEKNFEKIAFLGQVPVRVFGKVNLGDYILPNGVNNGIGIAVSPENIKPEQVRNIVGIAWSSSDNAAALNKVNVALGLNVNDNQHLIKAQQNEINELKDQIAQTNSQLEKLIPGFKSNTPAPKDNIVYGPGTSKNTATIISRDAPITEIANLPATLAPNEVKYVEVKREDFVKGFEIAYDKMKATGKMEDRYQKFWDKYNSDATYRNLVLDKLMDKYTQELSAQKALDA